MAVPEVYAGFGSSFSEVNPDSLYNKNIMSGPNWFYTLTGNAGGVEATGTSTEWGRTNKGPNSNWYCLDLLNKYHQKSALKQFHALTIYFRDVNNANKGAIITSTLPESFSYSIGGIWQNPIQLSGGEIANTFIQSLTNQNASLSFSVDTSLIWQSPKRMDIIFKIPVLDDSGTGTHRNYQEAIELLSEAILPEVGETGIYESIPGPSIFTALAYRATEGKNTKGAQTLKSATENVGKTASRHLYGRAGMWNRISVQVGSMLLLDWCIIKDLKVTFPNTKAQVLHDYRARETTYDKVGNMTSSTILTNKKNQEYSLEGEAYNYKVHLQPIQAELELTISTVMGMTRATFKDMLYQTPSKLDTSNPENKKYAKGQTEKDWQEMQEKTREM